MLFESEWSGDVIAAPVWVTDDPQEETFAGFGDRMRDLTSLHLNQSGEAPDRCDLTRCPHRRRWISLLTSMLGELRSRMHRRREIRRISAAWAMVDDRTLNDIGMSRLEFEYVMDARHWG
jgi:uncharacterized protein YjiS (DUF1127 family)